MKLYIKEVGNLLVLMKVIVVITDSKTYYVSQMAYNESNSFIGLNTKWETMTNREGLKIVNNGNVEFIGDFNSLKEVEGYFELQRVIFD